MAATTPFLSVVTPVYDPPTDALEDMIRSVVEQPFQDWELILVDDRSTQDAVREVLAAAAAADRRIRVVERTTNGGIVAASNDAIEIARGEFVVLLDHDDLLAENAFDVLVPALRSSDDVDYAYSDEDKIGPDGTFYDVFRKPDWSPERLRHQMYTSHLSAIRTWLLREVGAFSPGFDGSQDHDLVLRVTERARRVVHIPEVLYHWRVVPGSTAGGVDAKPYAWEAGRRAVDAHLKRVGIQGEALLGPVPGTYRVRRELSPDTRISVVIPTRGGRGLIWGEWRCFVIEAVRSVVDTTHAEVEIVVVYDTATPTEVLDALREVAGDRLVLEEYTEPFNFSAKCNAGAVVATGDVIVLMNDDVLLRQEGSLDTLAAILETPGVGMAGARLLFEDGRLQHGGHVYDGGDWYHARFQATSTDYGPFSALLVGREASGLTAACLAVRKETYEEAGGLYERLSANFNDVDFSYKVRSLGLSLVWTPEVTAYHFESQTRVPVVHEWEVALVRERWGVPGVDPYFPQDSRV